MSRGLFPGINEFRVNFNLRFNCKVSNPKAGDQIFQGIHDFTAEVGPL